MEVRLILFKEIGFGISLNNPSNQLSSRHFRFRKPNFHFAELHTGLKYLS